MFKFEDYEKSANYIKEKMGGKNPKIAVVLGSGLGSLSEEIQDQIVISYKDIPNFPTSTSVNVTIIPSPETSFFPKRFCDLINSSCNKSDASLSVFMDSS